MTSSPKFAKIAPMETKVEASKSQHLMRSLLVFLLPCLATAMRFRNGFVFDDVFVIVRGQFIHDLHNLPRAFTEHTMVASSLNAAVGKPAMDTYRPLSIVSFFWDSLLSGHAPWSYHLTNMLLHGLVCVLVLQLLNGLLPYVAPRIRVASVVCFALAPWPAEAYVFINGRSDLFLALFFVAGLLLQRRSLAESRAVFAWLSGLSTLLALLSKEVAVVALPFLVLVPTSRIATLRQRAHAAIPHVLALFVYLALRANALTGLRTHSDGSQLLLALRNLPILLLDGLEHALLPTPYYLRSLRDDYATLPMAAFVAAALVLVALVAFGFWSWRRSYVVTWALFLALSTLAPVAMISTSLWPGFGRYLYVPAIGATILFAVALHAIPARSPRFAALVRYFPVALALCSFALLVDMTLGFVDEESVYMRSVQHVPDQAWSHGFLGLSLKRDGRCPQAVPLLQRAATMEPDDARYQIHLARCFMELRALEPALQVAQQGAQKFHDTRQEAGFLIIEATLLASHQPVAARALLERCLALSPERTDCEDLLGHLPK
jgi:tetratricopeptide (TPR) repeat protein